MSVQMLQKDQPTQLAVRLLDASWDPVTGVAYSALTVAYKKHGDTSWSTKTVASGDWSEGPQGRYLLTFSASELDTAGRFYFRVSASGAKDFIGDVDVVEDWADVTDLMTDLMNALNTKVSQEGATQAKQTQDEHLNSLQTYATQLEDKIDKILNQSAALKLKVDSLT